MWPHLPKASHSTVATTALCLCLTGSPLGAQKPPLTAPGFARLQSHVSASVEQLPNHTCRMDIRRAHVASNVRAKIRSQIELQARERRERILAETAARQEDREKGRLAPQTLEEEYRAIEADEADKTAIIAADIPLDIADALALEVAVVDGKELYSFPNSPRFESIPLAALIGHGTVATGVFAGHAKRVVADHIGEIKYIGERDLDGLRVHRYDYVVALDYSRYSVTNKGQTTRVPYHGSFWATVDGDQLLRLTIRVDDIPRDVGVEGFATQIEYQTLQVGGRDLLLPQRSHFSMLLSTGVESVVQTRFEDCRSFVGSSVLSFNDDTARFYVEKTEVIENLKVPAGVLLPIRLETAIDSSAARVGSRVEAVLLQDVLVGEQVLPAGAILSGRLRRLEYYGGADSYFAVGIEFQELLFGSNRAVISLALERVANNFMGAQRQQPPSWIGSSPFRTVPKGHVYTSMRNNSPTIIENTTSDFVGHELFGVGVVYVQTKNTNQLRLTPGLQMAWRTVSAASSDID